MYRNHLASSSQWLSPVAQNCLSICWINSDGSGGIAQFAMLISLRCLVSDNRLYMFKCILKFPSVHMFPRVLCYPGPNFLMSPPPVSNVPHVICSIMSYVHPCSMFHRVICSPCSMFPLVICSPGPNFPGCYVPPPPSNVPLILCPTCHMFPMFYVIAPFSMFH